MANTLGIYEYSKPVDLYKLLTIKDTHAAYIKKHLESQVMPLFWVEQLNYNGLKNAFLSNP
jgi:hypothetical protein